MLLRVLTAASLLAAAVHAGLAFHAWRRRTRSPLTLPFIGLCVAFGVSSLTLGLVGFAPSAPGVERESRVHRGASRAAAAGSCR
ncbi:MAG TPA: hypothetical protein PK313_16760, partial [Myxococcota bacterium]|nr:hypothetical protein [Myxococcota bacterium]